MRILAEGPVRFTGIRSAIPTVSPNILTARLRALRRGGHHLNVDAAGAECFAIGAGSLGAASCCERQCGCQSYCLQEGAAGSVMGLAKGRVCQRLSGDGFTLLENRRD